MPSLYMQEPLSGVFKIWPIFIREFGQMLAAGRNKGNLSIESCIWGGFLGLYFHSKQFLLEK